MTNSLKTVRPARLTALYARWCWLYALSIQGMRASRLPYSKDTPIADKALIATSLALTMNPSSAIIEHRIRKLIKQRASIDAANGFTFRMAACAGRLELMIWLSTQANPSPYATEQAASWASENKHSEVLQWLRSTFNHQHI